MEEDIYVVEGPCRLLLGQPAIQSLKLLAHVGEIKGERKVEDLFPQLFTGLGRIEQEYTIKLSEGAKPFALNTPRRVPIPLMQQLRNELDRMKRLRGSLMLKNLLIMNGVLGWWWYLRLMARSGSAWILQS